MLWHVHHYFVLHIWYILSVTKKYNNVIVMLVTLWTLSAENKNGGDSWGTLYERSMERLVFRYDRH